METLLILLLALFSPLVEIFPNLYMSWWAPSNGKLQRYLDTWQRRVIVVIIVWGPILYILSRIIENTIIILLLSVLVFSAFGLRLYFFDKSLRQELKKRKSFPEPSKIPEYLYTLAFSSIGVVLYLSVPSNRWLVPLGILIIFLGGAMMSTFRRGKHKNLTWDIIGRCVFTIGFLLNLYNLVRAI
jgi:hypothetical protein